MMLAMSRRKHQHYPHASTFRQRFARDPRPDDPVFWSDRSTDEPIPMSEEEVRDVVRNALERAGLPGDDVVSRRILGLD